MRKKDENQVTEKSFCYFIFFFLILWSWWYNIWEGGISFTIPEICAPSFQEPPLASTCTILGLSRLSGNYGMGRYRLKFLQKNGLKPDSYPNAKIVKQMTTLIGSSILQFCSTPFKSQPRSKSSQPPSYSPHWTDVWLCHPSRRSPKHRLQTQQHLRSCDLDI